jgi:hypothetical protein
MKKYLRTLFGLLLIVSLLIPTTGLAASPTPIPTFSITAVVRDTNVTIYTNNFPANDNFDVLMNTMGTQGKNGIKVATTNSGKGGSFSATYTIPSQLKGLKQIAIRLQSNTGSGYFSYNWFYNNTTGSSGGTKPVYSGIPTFSITAVVRNKTVTIYTKNFPPKQTFTVLMNVYGTLGKNGIKVTTINSGSGGAFSATFNIPADLNGLAKIAIRLESSSGYYAYNWFYNTTTN